MLKSSPMLPAAFAIAAIAYGCSSESSPVAPPDTPPDAAPGDAGPADASGDTGGCVPGTCSSLGAECGTSPDGCGGVIECGDCPAGESCGGDGPNRCGKQPCTPIACPSNRCGKMSDGCSLTLDCGQCSAPDTCGGGGLANVCGCTPSGCGSLNCGSISDNCGATVSCGSCSAPNTCGGGGTPLVCGCTPSGCGTHKCGEWDNGCGGTNHCGTCTFPATCGGGGNPYECGCAPKDCSTLSLCDASENNFSSSASYDDGCSGYVNCGDCCHAGEFCSGSSTLTEWKCACGNPGLEWVPQDQDCYHHATSIPCEPGP